MRILFTFAGGAGHLNPLLPIARAVASAGHAVAFAGQPALLPAVEAAGFVGFDTGGDTIGKPQPGPLLELDRDREDRALSAGFAGRVARERAAQIVELSAWWRPELVVCDEVDYGAMVAAEHLGLPHASVVVIAAGSFNRSELVAGPLGELRARYGLPPDPDAEMLRRYLVLSPVPPSFRDPACPLPATAHAIRPAGASGPSAPSGGQAVYFTLGTIVNVESGDLFSRVLQGIRELPIEVVVTVGEHIDPAGLGPQPSNVHIEQYVPQDEILPGCGAVVSHGGSGSVVGALAHGLPSVLLPIGADQPHNAARCETLGTARVLNAVTATPEQVREALSDVLTDPSYRAAAERLATESASLPGVERAVTLLETLATEKRPVLANLGS